MFVCFLHRYKQLQEKPVVLCFYQSNTLNPPNRIDRKFFIHSQMKFSQEDFICF